MTLYKLANNNSPFDYFFKALQRVYDKFLFSFYIAFKTKQLYVILLVPFLLELISID